MRAGPLVPRPSALLAVLFLAGSATTGCGTSTPKPLGTEGAACYAELEGDAGADAGAARCNEGLLCNAESRLCERPGGGGEIIDTASEAPADAAAQDSDATADARPDGAVSPDGGPTTDARPDAAVSPDGGAAETATDAPATEGGDASDGSASETTPDTSLDGGVEAPASGDAGDAAGEG